MRAQRLAVIRACCVQLAPDFRELRNISVSNLMYVKEDLIIPNQYTFYDLIINKVLRMPASGCLHTVSVPRFQTLARNVGPVYIVAPVQPSLSRCPP